MGLAALALETNPVFPTYPMRMSDADVTAGLVLPNAAVAMLGKGGAAASLLLIFMAVTSASSAEFIAVSSIFTYDIYQTYFNPQASGKRLIYMAHTCVVVYAILLAAFSTGLYCKYHILERNVAALTQATRYWDLDRLSVLNDGRHYLLCRSPRNVDSDVEQTKHARRYPLARPGAHLLAYRLAGDRQKPIRRSLRRKHRGKVGLLYPTNLPESANMLRPVTPCSQATSLPCSLRLSSFRS